MNFQLQSLVDFFFLLKHNTKEIDPIKISWKRLHLLEPKTRLLKYTHIESMKHHFRTQHWAKVLPRNEHSHFRFASKRRLTRAKNCLMSGLRD